MKDAHLSGETTRFGGGQQLERTGAIPPHATTAACILRKPSGDWNLQPANADSRCRWGSIYLVFPSREICDFSGLLWVGVDVCVRYEK